MRKNDLNIIVRSLILGLLILCLNFGCERQIFKHDIDVVPKPWNHLDFKNNPGAFQFAIVGDRTGGHRKGVFPEAVQKLNLLQPEFVMSVGDLIEGYSEDAEELREQWEEFNTFVNDLEMPFFYVAGNHDISNRLMARMWEDMHGRRYYYFIYKDVLFLCLDSQDKPVEEGKSPTPGGLGAEQIRWVKEVVNRHKDVRWIFVFMHQPLWAYEGGPRKEPPRTGFKEIEEALKDRDYTVFAGHLHSFTKYIQSQKYYYRVATTGGVSRLRGPSFGEFEGVIWVTITPSGPRLAILTLEGINDDDMHTEMMESFRRQRLIFDCIDIKTGGKNFKLPIKNPTDQPMDISVEWNLHNSKYWSIMPDGAEAKIKPFGEIHFKFLVRRVSDGPLFPLPVYKVRAQAQGFRCEYSLRMPMINLDRLLRNNRPTIYVKKAATAPKIDGNLDDEIWRRAPDAKECDFMNSRLDSIPSVRTEGWVAYDEAYYYVAMRCQHSGREINEAGVGERDGDVYRNDCVAVMLDTNRDRRSYYHFAVNPEGVLFDSYICDRGFNSGALVATGKNKDFWTMELAVPWSDMMVSPPFEKVRMGFLLARVLPAEKCKPREVLQYPPLNGENDRIELFGDLEFK